jgi:hypothetical protein
VALNVPCGHNLSDDFYSYDENTMTVTGSTTGNECSPACAGCRAAPSLAEKARPRALGRWRGFVYCPFKEPGTVPNRRDQDKVLSTVVLLSMHSQTGIRPHMYMRQAVARPVPDSIGSD